MIIVDKALEKKEKEGQPIRIGLIGAGYMGCGIALQLLKPLPGMRLVAIANRTLQRAEKTYRDAGATLIKIAENVKQVEKAIYDGEFAITDDPSLLCEAEGIDAIIEATGEIEFGCRVVLKAIENGKHVVLMNSELDATLGPILKIYADRVGVVITNTDGDEPGVAMNLFRFVKTIGFKPVLAGNLKGMIDRHRTPDTQRAFAEKYNQKPILITSFADGTKLSMECTVLANATGFRVARRGMYGFHCDHVKNLWKFFPPELLLEHGIIDYALNAEPHTGAFVVGHSNHPTESQYLDYFKMGEGPFYVFYTPYHLPHLQISMSVARAVLFHDATVTPLGKPVCDVITIAKRDIRKGEMLDGIGGFTCYGMIDNADECHKENLLPMGLSEGCIMKIDVSKDQAIKYADVELPKGRLSDDLRLEQTRYFSL